VPTINIPTRVRLVSTMCVRHSRARVRVLSRCVGTMAIRTCGHKRTRFVHLGYL